MKFKKIYIRCLLLLSCFLLVPSYVFAGGSKDKSEEVQPNTITKELTPLGENEGELYSININNITQDAINKAKYVSIKLYNNKDVVLPYDFNFNDLQNEDTQSSQSGFAWTITIPPNTFEDGDSITAAIVFLDENDNIIDNYIISTVYSSSVNVKLSSVINDSAIISGNAYRVSEDIPYSINDGTCPTQINSEENTPISISENIIVSLSNTLFADKKNKNLKDDKYVMFDVTLLYNRDESPSKNQETYQKVGSCVDELIGVLEETFTDAESSILKSKFSAFSSQELKIYKSLNYVDNEKEKNILKMYVFEEVKDFGNKQEEIDNNSRAILQEEAELLIKEKVFDKKPRNSNIEESGDYFTLTDELDLLLETIDSITFTYDSRQERYYNELTTIGADIENFDKQVLAWLNQEKLQEGKILQAIIELNKKQTGLENKKETFKVAKENLVNSMTPSNRDDFSDVLSTFDRNISDIDKEKNTNQLILDGYQQDIEDFTATKKEKISDLNNLEGHLNVIKNNGIGAGNVVGTILLYDSQRDTKGNIQVNSVEYKLVSNIDSKILETLESGLDNYNKILDNVIKFIDEQENELQEIETSIEYLVTLENKIRQQTTLEGTLEELILLESQLDDSVKQLKKFSDDARNSAILKEIINTMTNVDYFSRQSTQIDEMIGSEGVGGLSEEYSNSAIKKLININNNICLLVISDFDSQYCIDKYAVPLGIRDYSYMKHVIMKEYEKIDAYRQDFFEFKELMGNSIGTSNISPRNRRISQKIDISGRGSAQANKIVAYIKNRNPRSNDGYTTRLINTYMLEAPRENINSDVAIAMMLDNTNFLRNTDLLDRYNFGAFSSNNAVRFNSMSEGVRAHIQHTKAYITKDNNFATTVVDPRFDVLREKGLRGTVSSLDELIISWYGNSRRLSSITSIVSDLQNLN